MDLTAGEIFAMIGVALLLALIVAIYMVISRRKGWM